MGLIDNLKVLVGSKQAAGQVGPVGSTEEKKKILILEDDQQLQAVLEKKFQIVGFVVFKAENGQKGLELALSQKPNLILLDLLMPVMDGRTFLKKIGELPEFSTIPVIILTNVGNLDNMAEMRLFNNVKEFLVKANVTPDEIVEKVNQII